MTRKDAIKARQAAIVAAQNKSLDEVPAPVVIESRTVEEVFNEFREKGRSDRAYNTKLKQDSLWKNHLQAAFGNRFIDEITTAEVQDFLAMLYYDDGYAYRYVESFLKMFYRYLVRHIPETIFLLTCTIVCV